MLQLEAGQLYLDRKIGGVNGGLPASSRLSPFTLEASNALLPPLRSHGQQLGGTGKTIVSQPNVLYNSYQQCNYHCSRDCGVLGSLLVVEMRLMLMKVSERSLSQAGKLLCARFTSAPR